MIGKVAIAAVLVGAAAAWPAAMNASAIYGRAAADPIVPFPEYPGTPGHGLYNKFDPVAQKIDTTGIHAWQAPGPGDIRGPCPALNAAANHGYIARNGIVTSDDIFSGMNKVFNFDAGPAAVTFAADLLFGGDPVSGKFSIGFHSALTQSVPLLGNLLGNESGICAYGHNRAEGDASITRGDWLAPDHNSNCASYPEFTQQLLELAKLRSGPTGNITPRIIAEHMTQRRQHSIMTNPNYFAPPFAGFFIPFAAGMFAYNILSNRSAEYPRGYLSPSSFESLWGYKRDANNNLVYTYGHDRIPDNYYKSAADDAWTVEDILVSTAQKCASYPTDCQIGGNLGTVNSFTGVNLGDISGGLVNSSADLTDTTRIGCFIYQSLQAEAPTFLSNVFSGVTLTQVLGLVGSILTLALAQFQVDGLITCPNLPKGKGIFDPNSKYPGARALARGNRNPF